LKLSSCGQPQRAQKTVGRFHTYTEEIILDSNQDGGGFPNLPALFALADFHLFSVIYAAVSCAAMSTFAGHSAPRIRHRCTSSNRTRDSHGTKNRNASNW